MIRKPRVTESKTFRVGKVEPESLSSAEFVKTFDTAMNALKTLEKDRRGKREVEIKVNHNNPIQLILAGDLHLGSFATNQQMCDNLRDYLLATPNTILVLLGDEIEGFKAKYASTNLANTIPGLSDQLKYFYFSFFKPLADAGKIAAVVSGYWGHNGWVHDDTTLNIWEIQNRFDERVPLIANGGILTIRFKNGQTTQVEVHHNPPGKSKIDPVHGLRVSAQAQNPSNRPDIYASGHLHRAMVGTDLSSGVSRGVNFIQAGSPKGSDKFGNTDPFGEKLGLPHTDPWLQGIVLQPPKGQKGTKSYVPEIQLPFISAKQGALVHGALELLNLTESTGVTSEIMEQIYDEFPAPETSYLPNRSKVSSSPAELLNQHKRELRTKDLGDKVDERDIRPLYERVAYNIKSELPIIIHPIGNARLGSFHESGSPLPVETYARQIAENNYAFALFLRSVIDKDVARQPNRIEVLQRYIDLVHVFDGRALAIMLDTSLGNKSWLRRLGDLYDLRPIAAGSYLSGKTGTRLVHHMSYVDLSVGPGNGYNGNTRYMVQLADTLLRHGSFSSTKGLKRVEDLYSPDRPSIIIGGHVPTAGTSQFYDRTNRFTDTPATLAPGWWAKFVDTTGTRSKGGLPGQAVILIPGHGQGESMMIPTSSAEQTSELSQAITLQVGSEKLGLSQKLRRSNGNGRR